MARVHYDPRLLNDGPNPPGLDLFDVLVAWAFAGVSVLLMFWLF